MTFRIYGIAGQTAPRIPVIKIPAKAAMTVAKGELLNIESGKADTFAATDANIGLLTLKAASYKADELIEGYEITPLVYLAKVNTGAKLLGSDVNIAAGGKDYGGNNAVGAMVRNTKANEEAVFHIKSAKCAFAL